ncbi:MAG: hypothetical protein HYZ53_06170 [Planctomycetes bacterium]|nr:hypothetical protein [Planctomycetota bacterium]
MVDSNPSAGAPATPTPQYVLKDGNLAVLRDPRFSDAEFARHCKLLLQCPQEELLLDLSRVAYVQSPEIAAILAFLNEAEELGKTVELKVSKTVYTVLRRMSLDHIVGLHRTTGGTRKHEKKEPS